MFRIGGDAGNRIGVLLAGLPIRERISGEVLFPRSFIGQQSLHEPDVGVEHRVKGAGAEQRFASVPIEEDSAVELGDLSVQDDLRALRDDPCRGSQATTDGIVVQLAEVQSAGVDDRCEHPMPVAGAAQIAQHFDPRIGGIAGDRLQALLQTARSFDERQSRG